MKTTADATTLAHAHVHRSHDPNSTRCCSMIFPCPALLQDRAWPTPLPPQPFYRTMATMQASPHRLADATSHAEHCCPMMLPRDLSLPSPSPGPGMAHPSPTTALLQDHGDHASKTPRTLRPPSKLAQPTFCKKPQHIPRVRLIRLR